MKSLEYMAGFFDGEGCIHARWGDRHSDLQIMIAQNDPAPLNFFVKRYGGRLGKKATGIWNWNCPRASMITLLQDFLPHLVVKKSQAELAISWINVGRCDHASRHNPNENNAVWENRKVYAQAIRAEKHIASVA